MEEYERRSSKGRVRPALLSRRPVSSTTRLRGRQALLRVSRGIIEVDLATSDQHVSTLVQMLALKVVERDHPRGVPFSKEDDR